MPKGCRRRSRIFLVLASGLILVCGHGTAISQSANRQDPRVCSRDFGDTLVRLETDLGAIDVRLYADRAPITVCNFLRYVGGGFFDGGMFFRTVRPDNQRTVPVKIGVIQADVAPNRSSDQFAPIVLERTSQTGIRHLDGTISMARDGPDSATASFSICVGDQPSLDFGGKRNPDGQGFAAFGRVVRGMDVVRRIQRSPAKGEVLVPAVAIKRAYRVELPSHLN